MVVEGSLQASLMTNPLMMRPLELLWSLARHQRTNSTGSGLQVRVDLENVISLFYFPEEKLLPCLVLIFLVGYIITASVYYLTEI